MTKTLYAEFTVKPGSEARVAEMMRELTEQVRSGAGQPAVPALHAGIQPPGVLCFRGVRGRCRVPGAHQRGLRCRFNGELADHIEEDGSVLTWLQPVH